MYYKQYCYGNYLAQQETLLELCIYRKNRTFRVFQREMKRALSKERPKIGIYNNSKNPEEKRIKEPEGEEDYENLLFTNRVEIHGRNQQGKRRRTYSALLEIRMMKAEKFYNIKSFLIHSSDLEAYIYTSEVCLNLLSLGTYIKDKYAK